MTDTDRRWSDADRELVASHISDRSPHDAAGDILDALAAAGRLATDEVLQRLSLWVDSAGRIAALNADGAAAELQRLRARVAELEQTLAATRQQLLAEAKRLMRRPAHPPVVADTAWWLRRLAECPVCSGPSRETTGMVCQACGKDWGPPAKPGFWLDENRQWQPLSATPPGPAGGEQ